jgi:ATP-dependent protease ClpP protease subunit
LYHEGSTATVGDAGKFNNFADFYKKQLELLKKITISCTNITEEMYKEHQKDDWWIDANEALELGICDEIVDKFI